jgi:hypothetical protein
VYNNFYSLALVNESRNFKLTVKNKKLGARKISLKLIPVLASASVTDLPLVPPHGAQGEAEDFS